MNHVQDDVLEETVKIEVMRSALPNKAIFMSRRDAMVRIGKIALGVALPLVITLNPTEAKAYT